ncbi:MAG: hypothetical protein EAZ70_12580 [Runella slithyformis]|jgi:hypothetical protein|nr:MAG: hypothetical protein EAY79_12910 [Runella slithyformis]TAF96193.1 MAG: hypothetical protein EAZ46_05845 [Runella sp.]TAG20226.1 MAG: hypothetical protein EAZ38_10820 [Cytophagales bacterium]TAG39345.1 MAG: hypothetical protein EAZ32_10270 [Cytophagia bacterium]TAF23847.1 MAG: hypothetical protein EAZ70_12580 [Runella slithyformis]
MINLSLKLDEKILEETELVLLNLKQSRNSYINEAVAYYNQLKKRAQIATQLATESNLVRTSSMEVLAEMENLEKDYEY